ncbi:dual oxidase maturation factor 1-like isoform X2 [Homarus americanus]|uniref:dual oxidase maturation factor 1-like isoform X2 n=1 Tax=Homarus americanus TaxID=6706 RepID=UPI001C4614DE|nr:dual oxidase maturation factor 1-like isoform X2 [Homarus americanus]
MSVFPSSPGWFDASRMKPFPTQYEELKNPAHQDVLYMGWIAAYLTLFVSFCLCVIPATQGKKEMVYHFIRVTAALGLGLVIMACNFGQNWEEGQVDTLTPYKAGSGAEIEARVGVKLGLRSVNITLKALKEPEEDLKGEEIDYNERFSWEWAQGRAGFGPFAGEMQRNFRAAQQKGLPLPILWVAEYFTFDGEGIRFGRFYRTSGWYSHIFIWLSFALWILTLILFKMVISYGAIFLFMTGSSLTISALIWSSNRNFIELAVPFTPPNGILRTTYGIHWYLALVTGVLCMATGVIIWGLSYLFPDQVKEVFGNVLTIEDQEIIEVSNEAQSTGDIEMRPMDTTSRQGRIVTLLKPRGTRFGYSKKINYTSFRNSDVYDNVDSTISRAGYSRYQGNLETHPNPGYEPENLTLGPSQAYQPYPSYQQGGVEVDQYPGSQGQYPGSQDQYPGSQGQYPGSQDQYPGSQDQYPGSQDQYPGSQDQAYNQDQTAKDQDDDEDLYVNLPQRGAPPRPPKSKHMY